MGWFKNLKIGAKLMLSFGMIIFLVIGFSVYSIIMARSISSNYLYMSEYPVNRLEMWLNIEVNFNKAYRALAMMSVYAPESADATSSATGAADTATSAPGAVDATSSATVAEGITKNMEAQHDIIESALKEMRLNIEVCRESIYYDPNLSNEEWQEQEDVIQSILHMLTTWENKIVGPVMEANTIGDRWAVSNVYKEYIGTIDTLSSAIDGLTADAKTEAAAVKLSTSEAAARTITVLIIIAVIIVILGVVLAQNITVIIKKPIDNMITLFSEVATGNVDITVDRSLVTRDEIGELIKGFIGLIDNTKQQVFVAEHIAAGDLTVDIHQRSDKDAMNIALHRMTETLNAMLGEINNATAQVFTGSKQLADSSQTLAQGSTEQSAVVEQLSSSISIISEKTKTNADTANKAANLANTIMSNAEKGSRQMSEMMAAVKEINEASQSINKVIKVIDDIAFQTNILALNAAVEAARAGQHGKGFAVVAEEVRNLASKSAEAAQDTGALISSTIEKAALGARIADDTSASLTAIVSGISESSQLVGEIARSSEEQATGISQLNTGIDQVANVIQQNSAAAEESSAASEEMSGQAAVMESMVSRFKLRDSSSDSLQFTLPEHDTKALMPKK